MRIGFIFTLAVSGILLSAARTIKAQANLPIYTDNLVNGFQNWSWATVNLENTSPVHSGGNSISVTDVANYQALYLEHSDFDTAPYESLDFWINGGASGGQTVQATGLLDGAAQTTYPLGRLHTNSWQHFIIPLSTLGVANKTNFSGLWIQSSVSSAQPTFYVDDIQLIAAPAPATVHLNVDAAQTIRSVDARWFGLNTAVWDSDFDSAATSNALKEIGCLTLRFPGGSLSDEYHWATDRSLTNTWTWPTSFGNFMHVATNLGAQVFITVNYGTGDSNEAAAWVRSANVTNHCDFKYWEIGNECYGSWETDSNSPPHDPYTYATRAANYIAAMKAADPTIKIGVVVAAGEDSNSNNAAHPVINPRTGRIHYGWTPVLLTTLKNLGVTPDFAIYHFYPEYGADSDPLLFQSTANWARDAADLRQQISDYFGDSGTNIELCVTENNSDAGAQGRQSTSLVNALYLADSLGQLMKTEFNSFIWWDLRNGQDTSGDFDPTLYGWRSYGDLGIMSGDNNFYPTFYAEKLLQHFARPGDSVIAASSDYLLLSAYAVRRADGALALLVINKDAVTNFSAQISLTHFEPWTNATIQSYGIPQDEAARTNAAISLQDIATTYFPASADFTYSFPPYSLTLFTFAPAPARLSAFLSEPGQVVFELQGQSGGRYIIQSSTNLATWTAVSTNTLAESILNITNSIQPGATQKFWLAVWQNKF
ncbi:MAG: alpha-L-arabinofuranosidase [Limisphaerales bacterium]